jgi:hypothetical protein
MDNITPETASTIKCMCGNIIPENEVVFVNPSTKAITWTAEKGLPYCKGCVPVVNEDL